MYWSNSSKLSTYICFPLFQIWKRGKPVSITAFKTVDCKYYWLLSSTKFIFIMPAVQLLAYLHHMWQSKGRNQSLSSGGWWAGSRCTESRCLLQWQTVPTETVFREWSTTYFTLFNDNIIYEAATISRKKPFMIQSEFSAFNSNCFKYNKRLVSLLLSLQTTKPLLVIPQSSSWHCHYSSDIISQDMRLEKKSWCKWNHSSLFANSANRWLKHTGIYSEMFFFHTQTLE